ncbi:RDD family protein [Nannocystaceae bacterium ST9]
MDYNPYAPPSREAERRAPATLGPQAFVLAEPGARVLAKLIDALAISLAAAPGLTLIFTIDPDLGGLLLLFMPPLAWIAQWVLIGATGQSLGKRLLGLRVITSAGARVGFFRGVFLREWVMKAGSGVLYGFPLLLDPLFALGRARQCLHDHLADTLVIEARSAGDPYLHP